MILWIVACVGVETLPMGTSSEACGECHPTQLSAWKESPHGKTSEVFTELLPHVENSWGTFARQTCENCHLPEHTEEKAGETGCVSCHAAVGNHGESDGQLAINLEAPLAGAIGSKAQPTSAHQSEVRGFLQSESLCGTCHEVTGPAHFVEETLSEFRASPAYKDGETCQSCHAPPIEPGSWVPGGPIRPQSDHRYLGFDPELLAEALSISITETTVTLTNTGAGHAVPTGVSFFRRISLYIEGEPTPILSLGSIPMRENLPTPLITDADYIEKATLLPGASISAPLPEGPIVLELLAERFPAELLTALELGEAPAPTRIGRWERE